MSVFIEVYAIILNIVCLFSPVIFVFSQVCVVIFASNAFNEILETNFVHIEYQMITIYCSYIALSVLMMHAWPKRAFGILKIWATIFSSLVGYCKA